VQTSVFDLLSSTIKAESDQNARRQNRGIGSDSNPKTGLINVPSNPTLAHGAGVPSNSMLLLGWGSGAPDGI